MNLASAQAEEKKKVVERGSWGLFPPERVQEESTKR